MREMSSRVSNWRATGSLPEFLQHHQIVALSEVDTRSLTRHLCTYGTKRGVIAAGDWNTEELIQKAKDSPRIEELDLVPQRVSQRADDHVAGSQNIVVYDFGVKRSILRSLASQGARIILVSANTSAEDVLSMHPDRVVLSNGPGDPARLGDITAEIAKLIGKVSLFGIALGHQILGRALGASTYKLPFGHRGTQPVLDKRTGKSEMTAQNHSFCIVPETLPPEVEVTHINLHDGSVEGFRHRDLPVSSAQFLPEHLVK